MQDAVICRTNAKLSMFSELWSRRRFIFCLVRKNSQIALMQWLHPAWILNKKLKQSLREQIKSGDDLLEIVKLQTTIQTSF